MSEIVLSIIIPMYNGKTYIEETVESLLPIACEKELLIIDDGSSDDSFLFCKDRWKDHPCVQVIRKENGGIVSARNFGLARAKGTYVLFCDHDDIAFPQTIDRAVLLAAQSDADAVIWSTTRYLGEKQFVPCDTVYRDAVVERDTLCSDIIPSMLVNRDNATMSYIGHIWAGLYRTETIKTHEIRFKRFVDIEDDYLFVLDFLSCARKVCFITETGYAWRYNLRSETYKQKYIDRYLQRTADMYRYIDQQIAQIALDSDVKARYRLYQKQDTLVRAIENGYTILNPDRSERKRIRARFRADRTAFRQASVVPYEKRRRRIFNLLQKGHLTLAGMYVYADSVYRKIRSKWSK